MKEETMLTVTEAAGGYLSDVLDKSNAPAETAVRLNVGPDGLSAAIDEPRPGDMAFDHDGRKVLLLDERASAALADRTLDLQPTPDGGRLGLR